MAERFKFGSDEDESEPEEKVERKKKSDVERKPTGQSEPRGVSVKALQAELEKEKAKILSCAEEKYNEKFDKLKTQVENLQDFVAGDERVALLNGALKAWNRVRESEISKWQSPTKGSKNMMELVSILDDFFKVQQNIINKLKKK
jgi:uncharacterized protein YecT (DUF1311 family)